MVRIHQSLLSVSLLALPTHKNQDTIWRQCMPWSPPAQRCGGRHQQALWAGKCSPVSPFRNYQLTMTVWLSRLMTVTQILSTEDDIPYRLVATNVYFLVAPEEGQHVYTTSDSIMFQHFWESNHFLILWVRPVRVFVRTAAVVGGTSYPCMQYGSRALLLYLWSSILGSSCHLRECFLWRA